MVAVPPAKFQRKVSLAKSLVTCEIERNKHHPILHNFLILKSDIFMSLRSAQPVVARQEGDTGMPGTPAISVFQ